MGRKIKKVAVLGAGVMGASIAAHLANVGIPCYLLDIVPPELSEEDKKKGLSKESPAFRNRLAIAGKENVVKAKPAALYVPEYADRITPGNLEDNMEWLGEVDWIIEVVVERLDIKKQVFERVEKYRKPGTIVSSNTSGISINAMAEGRSLEFRQHFLGTHFFNPPRYMKLLELIPCQDTLPEVMEFMSEFCQKVLGKGTVIAKDTPNFIANRIGTFAMLETIREMIRQGLTIEEVDALTGPVMGHPNSASFRTLDMVGLDTFVHVAGNVHDGVSDPAEKAAFEVPELLRKMLDAGLLGDKVGKGFYQRKKTEAGRETLALNYNTLEYRPREKAKLDIVSAAKARSDMKDKLNTLIWGEDKYSQFAWFVTKKAALYAASKVGEIADDIVSIDRAMRWGFAWELGPFEQWDLIGVRKTLDRMRSEGETIPPLVETLLDSGYDSFYRKENGKLYYFDHRTRSYQPVLFLPEVVILPHLKEQNKEIIKNSDASLIDLGDGVACLEMHSPNQAITADFIEMIWKSLEEVDKNFVGMVIGNQAKNFCVGANLFLVLVAAQNGAWDELEKTVKSFQDACMAIKYFSKPVVAAPFRMTLGGGCEICLHCHRVQADAETYVGQVEVAVGLLPGGGGNKEVLIRMMEGIPEGVQNVDIIPYVAKAMELIAMGKVATSAREAQKLGLFRKSDGVSVNGDHLIHDAKQAVLAMAQMGFAPPEPKKIMVAGETGYAACKVFVRTLNWGGYATEHDVKIAEKIGYVLCGGLIPYKSMVTEQYLLDLEREAFLSLVGEPKSQERMQYMLMNNRPLRN